jgi:hypothetical protein
MSIKQMLFNSIFPTAKASVPSALTDASTQSVNLDTAWIVLKKIEFKTDEVAGAAESEDQELEYTGPYYINLLDPAPAPIATKDLPAMPFHRIKMQLHKDGPIPAGAPSQLAGNSIYLAGTVGAHRISFASANSTEFSISGRTGITPDSQADLLVVFRFADLMRKIDLSSISADTAVSDSNRVPAVNACPQIDSSAADLYTCFRKGLESLAEFGKDSDGNGSLDDAHDQSVRD